MILSLNLSLTTIAILGAGKTSAPQPPPGFILLAERGGRLLTDGAGPVLTERAPSRLP